MYSRTWVRLRDTGGAARPHLATPPLNAANPTDFLDSAPRPDTGETARSVRPRHRSLLWRNIRSLSNRMEVSMRNKMSIHLLLLLLAALCMAPADALAQLPITKSGNVSKTATIT